MNTRQTRQFQARAIASDGSTGGLSGVGLAFGQLDSYGTVFAPGCADADCLDRFVRTGCLLSGHEWDDKPMGIITSAVSDGSGIAVDATFHSTEDAQELRTVIQERMDAGKTVGLSIGFRIANYITCRNGADLLAQAQNLGFDMSVFDAAAITAETDQCWLVTRLSELAEVSVVNFASVPNSEATSVRSPHNSLGGTPDGLTLADQLTNALGALEAVTTRSEEIHAIRSGENKQLGKDTLAKLAQIRDRIDSLLVEPEPEVDYEAERARKEALMKRADEIIKGQLK